jgi:hypothetical protein
LIPFNHEKEGTVNISPIQASVYIPLLKEPSISQDITFEDSPLFQAIISGQEDIALLLIEKGAPLDLVSPGGVNFLHMAAAFGCIRVCEALLGKGMDANSSVELAVEGEIGHKMFAMTPLLTAIFHKQFETARFLIRFPQGTDVNREIDREKNTLLHFFSTTGDLSTCQLLVEEGAKLDLLNDKQESPLFCAVEHGKYSIVEYLLKSGANPNIRNKDLNTPLHAAAHMDRDEQFFNCLLAHGADARALNRRGETPLMMLLARGFHIIEGEKFLTLREKDGGLTQIGHGLCLLGHRFSLKGPLFEGSHNHVTFSEVGNSFYTYLGPTPMDQSFLEIPFLFTQAAYHIGNVNYFLQKIEKGETTVIPLRWLGHATSLVISGNLLCKNNSGEMSGEKPGITIYEIQDTSNMREVLTKFLRPDSGTPKESENISLSKFPELFSKIKSDKVDFFNGGLEASLKLKELHYLDIHQKSKNCGWMAAKMALKGVLIVRQMQKNGSYNVQDAESQIKPTYDGWIKFDSLYAVSTAPYLTQETAFHPFYNVDQVFLDIALWFDKTKKVSLDDIRNAFPKI